MSLKSLRTDLHAQHCAARKLNYLVQSEDFGLAFETADSGTRYHVYKLVDNKAISLLREFIKDELAKLTPFHQMSMVRLRSMGQRLRVKDYNQLRKQELVKEIQDAINRIKESARGVRDQSEEAGATETHS